MKSKSELVHQRTVLLSATDILLGSRTGELRSVARRDSDPKASGRYSRDEKPQLKLTTG